MFKRLRREIGEWIVSAIVMAGALLISGVAQGILDGSTDHIGVTGFAVAFLCGCVWGEYQRGRQCDDQ